jgi:hypothetical protein
MMSNVLFMLHAVPLAPFLSESHWKKVALALTSIFGCCRSLHADELTIRARLAKEGAVVLSTAPAASATTAAAGEASLDFEIEPDVYRAVEAMVQSLAAGTHA